MATHAKNGDQNLLPPADWAGEIERLQEGISVERERTLRTLADFKNYRRRIEREGNKIAEEGNREIILPLLDILDDLEKALRFARDEENLSLKGVRIFYQKFLTLLETHGVLPFQSVGMPFDHNLHEAVAMTTAGGGTPGTVVDELRRGYLWHNELLRHAQVRVTQ
jgi:molecular chaperone GrpE